MWKKPAAAIGAGLAWGVGVADVIPGVALPTDVARLCVMAAGVLTGFVMLRCYQRPLGAAYDLGYKAGRRDAVVEATRRVDNVTHLAAYARRVENTSAHHPLMVDEVDAY